MKKNNQCDYKYLKAINFLHMYEVNLHVELLKVMARKKLIHVYFIQLLMFIKY